MSVPPSSSPHPVPTTGPDKQNPSRKSGWLACAVVALVAAIPVVWKSGLGIAAALETILRSWTHVLVLVLIPLAVMLWAGSKHEAREKTMRPSEAAKDRAVRALGTVSGAALAVAVLGGAYAFFVHPYLVASSYSASTTQGEQATSFADRAPWVVSNNYAQRDQGDIIGDREDVHYVPTNKDAQAEAGDGSGDGTSRYTVLVKERGMLRTGGYQAVQTLTMPTTGAIPSEASGYCTVPDSMGARLNSLWPWHSLSWSIHAKAPFAHWDPSDAYGYCDADQKPVVVVPLFAYSGFWNVTKVPNGAAIYTESGVQILSAEQLNQQGIQGPTYPRSIAYEQREAINAGGSLTDWWGSRYGYDLTNEDDDDANEDNSSEFTLIRADSHDTEYVTPLTPRGSSQSITAVSEVPARQTTTKQRETLTINTFPDLPATSTLTTAIKESSVRGDNAWTTRWSAGMGVYEILPAQDGHWVASIGQGQAVSYRADIAPDGSVTVVNADTGQSSDGPAADGDGREPVTVGGDKKLSEMTDAELLDLIKKGTEELQRREAADGN